MFCVLRVAAVHEDIQTIIREVFRPLSLLVIEYSRSLPLNDAATARGHDRTPTDRHRGFPERDREGSREHRRERDRDRERERDPFDFDGELVL